MTQTVRFRLFSTICPSHPYFSTFLTLGSSVLLVSYVIVFPDTVHKLPATATANPSWLLVLDSAHCQLPTAYCQLPTANCPLPTAYCQLPTAHCLLPTAYCLLPTANCPLPLHYRQCSPPSACMIAPFIQNASSVQSRYITFATSSGFVILPNGFLLMFSSTNFSFPEIFLSEAVSVIPACIILVFKPYAANSTAMYLARLSSEDLAIETAA